MTETDQRTRTGLIYAFATFGAWGVLLGPLFVRLATEALGIWRESTRPLDCPANTSGRAR